ncbi:hypothetical protein G9A89_009776 [Geosiphon pyriformis]|nr:hypothetical protein G9A89_009776 [Geosiphon pyriformis]
MSSQFLPFLLRDYTKLLEEAEDYDSNIKVGKEENARVFHAHSIILRARSSYFRKVLSQENVNLLAVDHGPKSRKQKVISIVLEKISPFAFNLLLRYMYTGILDYENYKAQEIIDILKTANELGLVELVNSLQDYLLERKTGWLQSHFATTYHTAFGPPSLLKFQQFCNKILDKSPTTILRSLDFNELSPDMVVSLLEREDLVELEEIHIWNRVVEWGIAQPPHLPTNVCDWSTAQFIFLRSTLRPVLPLIRYLDISPDDFKEKVAPFKSVFPHQLYSDIINSHLNPDFKPISPILSSRHPSFKINSVIINPKHAAWLAKYIDRKDDESPTENGHTDGSAYEFQLLLRGSRDGFTPEEFHRLCDKQGATITVIKTKETGQIIGGYNPFSWLSLSPHKWNKTNDSFIFTVGDENLNEAILSRVENDEYAICQDASEGPLFGTDIVLRGNIKDPKQCYCNKNVYEFSIMAGSDHEPAYFAVEEYEVFRVIKKRVWTGFDMSII